MDHFTGVSMKQKQRAGTIQAQHLLSQLQCGLAGEAPGSPLLLIFGDVLGCLKAHEEQRELHGGEVQLLEEPHAQDTSVKVQGHLGVLDAVHGLLEDEVLEDKL
ncbi:hypothetical protein E2C01_039742 [Portunus trituberculatus]|uniref:Uncharacterized protein n=1 Tax=Portunus trituberculatus TaxID=210409 RepID=A0A5B7FLI3_PORTR|nr:hypothetical protein [Portunus trituberculatus]